MTSLLADAALVPLAFTERGNGRLPGHLGSVATRASHDGFDGHFDIQAHHQAPNGFLHASSLIRLADALCGNATIANLRGGATGFTTIELKSNFFAIQLDGRVFTTTLPVHVVGSTQVRYCEVSGSAGKRLALFRCTQIVLKAKR